jgi:Holliday junction resolvasome RuvABC endonuclease subunit
MNKIQHYRILSIAPSTRGFGYAVLEGKDTLVDWGVKTVQGNKNANSLAKVEELIAYYQPEVLVLEDTEGSRRSARIKALSRKIIAMASTRKVSVKLFSQEQVRRTFFVDGKGTKHAAADIIAQRFSEELGSRLPPKRKPWMSEHYQMDIFDAVALLLVFRLKQAKFQTKCASIVASCDVT